MQEISLTAVVFVIDFCSTIRFQHYVAGSSFVIVMGNAHHRSAESKKKEASHFAHQNYENLFRLPVDIWILIFSYLSVQTLASAVETCKDWLSIITTHFTIEHTIFADEEKQTIEKVKRIYKWKIGSLIQRSSWESAGDRCRP